MDPKLFSQQGVQMNPQQNQQNANIMLPFQQQGQDMQSFNPLGSGLGVPFSNANLGSNMAFGQTDFANMDQADLANLNPFVQANPALMGMNVAALQQQQQQQQHLRQSNVYSPQNMMNLQNTNPAALQGQMQNRGMYQPNEGMMPNTPQALLFQQQQQQQLQQQQQQQQQQHQQQQQAMMAMNRAKQSPSQSPALNNAHFQGNAVGSPVVANSPHMAGARIGSEYASPMGAHMGSPVQNFQQGAGISPSPQMTRVIPSQANNRFMHMNAQPSAIMQPNVGGGSPSLNNPTIPSYVSSQDDNSMEDQASKNFGNTQMGNYVQQSPMQTHGSPIPRQSATPGSAHSTPRQQHQKLENINGTPQMSPAKPPSMRTGSIDASSLNKASPSPKLNAQAEVASPASMDTTQDKPQVTYIPKTRNVETYGGVDLKYFDKFEIKPPVPHLGELGIIDIQALILSLKSGMKMEMTNALNIITILTVQPQQQQQPPSLPLINCDDLLDVLLDFLEMDILGTANRFEYKPVNNSKLQDQMVTDLSYTDLFDMSLDEMKSLIPKLEHSTSDTWLSLRERCLCVFNVLRNLSFMNENVEYLANHKRFIELMTSIVDSTTRVSNVEGSDTTGKETWFVGVRRMDTLDFRKSILMIFSNISIYLTLPDAKSMTVFTQLIHDFLVHGPDTYYSLLAIETWTKLTVNHDNRQVLHSLLVKSTDKTMYGLLETIWTELAAVIRRDFFSNEGRVMHAMTSNQLAILELTVIGLYNIIAIVESEIVKQQLAQSNKSVAMMILRLCITLAESGNPQFSLVTKRGMELIRSLVCGGDGIRRRINPHQQKQPSPNLANSPQHDLDEGQLPIIEIAHRILDMPIVRERLMLAMLKPTTDPEILRELSDIVALIDDENIV